MATLQHWRPDYSGFSVENLQVRSMCLGQQCKLTLVRTPASQPECLGGVLVPAVDSCFLPMEILEGRDDGSRSWVPATHVRDLDCVSNSCLCPKVDPTIEARREVNKQMETHSLCSSAS